MKRKIIYQPHTLTLDIKPPYAISDANFDKWILAIKNTEISDITPHGNFIYGNKTGAIWLRVEILTRDGFTLDMALDKMNSIFDSLRYISKSKENDPEKHNKERADKFHELANQPMKDTQKAQSVEERLQIKFKDICRKYMLTPACGVLDALEEAYMLERVSKNSLKDFCESLEWDEYPDYSTIEALQKWGNIQWQQSQSDLVSKEKIIELLQQDAKTYKQYGDHIELRTVEDCISKIKNL